MKLTELCLRRPVLCTVLWLIPVFIGLLFSQKLPWRYTPQISQSKMPLRGLKGSVIYPQRLAKVVAV